MRGALSAVTWIGCLLVLFAAYSLWGTAFFAGRAQADLQRDFARRLATAAPSAARDATAVHVAPLDTSAPSTPVGEAIAMLKIPKIGLEQAVVRGTTPGALAKGPGHYEYTPLPGELGNAAIAGHRTTYGAPFFRLDELRPGDLMLVSTLNGTHRYVVTDTFVVSPRERSVLKPTDEPTLTLTTCHPAYRATERLVVRGVITTEEAVRTTTDLAAETVSWWERPPVLSGDTNAQVVRTIGQNETAPSALQVSSARSAGRWALAVVAVSTALQVVAQRRRVVAWLVFVLPLAVAVVGLFEAVHRLLPGGV
ncbi:MAG TPA: sortase [Acidimicrobiales bacterium]|nr:sortase [Acidimicrobiales bacterium]